MTVTTFGGLLRHHRRHRSLSQLALALRVETTTRHLSYVENGRSRPGRDLVLRLADALELSLRSRNELLAAAGLPPEFPAHAFSSEVLMPYRRAIEGLVAALDPYPAFVLDPSFRILGANAIGKRFLPSADGPAPTFVDAFFAPGPARELLANFAEVAWSFRSRLSRAAMAAPTNPELTALESRMTRYLAGVPRPSPDASGEPVICPTLRIDGQSIRTIGMTLRFGPSRDVTLEEMQVDVLYPRDEAAERWFRSVSRAESRPGI
jgi:transcriptional regulator with XRE-family HTH domain